MPVTVYRVEQRDGVPEGPFSALPTLAGACYADDGIWGGPTPWQPLHRLPLDTPIEALPA